ncbi:MAG: Xanthine dehydrogenase molybdenum-binding subunit [Chloroflexi bacterium ADurb.Bin325]|nr:MAG: Xanthine dehydrogenase molybdenum-binding subunit [Chloroflexi bacterium ADurb.Bin325]
MLLRFTLNDRPQTWEVAPNESLLDALRRHGVFGVKHGCETGECGACTVRLDGVPVTSCTLLAAQADGRSVATVEALGEHPEQGWKHTAGLHPLQQAFIQAGAIQCGYCTPAQLLAAQALLERNPNPTEAEVRDALSGVLCRCTGYVKPVQAVLRAAAILRGEEPPAAPDSAPPSEPPLPVEPPQASPAADDRTPPGEVAAPASGASVTTQTRVTLPVLVVAPAENRYVGAAEPKVDAVKLAQGKPAFVADVEMRGMLVGKLLHSPIAHGYIKRIDVSRARALPGVHAVLTYADIPRVVHSTAGQSDPIPGPLDFFSLDRKLRCVGDRVAAVAAESEEIAQRALDLIEVEYEELPAILDPRESMAPGAPIIHDEPEYTPFADCDPARNLAAAIRIELGDVDAAMQTADHIFEGEYQVPKVQQTPIEPMVCITHWDENDRLVIRTSTQVPFHARRMLAPVLGLPIKRIRVIKPRIGGGFGNKQEVLIEDICAHLTIATGRPVKMEYTRAEQFLASTSRHPMCITMRTGVMADGRIVANEMRVLSDTGAYGNHALTVTGNTGHKAMSLYPANKGADGQSNIRFVADVVYTNTPTAGAYRGYGVPQGFYPLECHMERIARGLGLDPLAFRLMNVVQAGEEHAMAKAWSEGRVAHPELIRTNAIHECARLGAELIGWTEHPERRPAGGGTQSKDHLRRGKGVALVMQGTAIPNLDMGAASLKMNDDGSFNLLVGATDLGTGSDTVLTQMAAEVLGCPPEDFITYSSDTDFTPFDKGAYASSTTYISGAAVVEAARGVAEQIKAVAGRMLGAPAEEIMLAERQAWAPDGRSVTLAEVALESLHHSDQHQIMAVGSHVSPDSPPPFAAQFADVTVDIETGQITVEKLVMVLDCGVIVNPATATGQVEGGMTQALGYAVCEEMVLDERGRLVNPRFGDYRIFTADEMPELQVRFVPTYEPTHPFGVKAVAEIPLDGVAPAVANAVYDATGIETPVIPLTPERVWRALKGR